MIKEMWRVCTMEHYSATKRDEIWSLARTQMDLEGIMLREIGLSEKDRYCMISFICGI